MVCLKLLALSLLPLLPTATAQSANATIRYMPFGDSITEIICWRAKLWEKLQSTEWATVNWVGSGKTENNCKDTKYDRDNEGHSGFLAIDIANKGQLDGWLKTNPADVITMHLGTNDIVQQNKGVTDIIAAFTKLVATMRTSNPKMKIIVAQIIPIGIGSYNSKIQQLNTAIIPWAQGLNKTESPIWVVDQYTGFSTSDLRDGVHPNDAGDVKMTNVWYPAILTAFAAAKAEKAAAKMTEVEFEA
ncbi:SGNH hydrolase-type esterase domain-containing protein [Phaeosphaeria sp. MPI-PUGE-AT-0046c]|nr:SGNH hydrolase-type esterase domain-containing protein [Phaeosphaeria sp. MPI-PUGE-AT-0046c]